MTEKFEGKIPEVEKTPEKVKAILDWLGNKTLYAGGKSLAEYAADAPKEVTKDDVREAFLRLKPLGVAMASHDLRGYYITALAHRVLEERIAKWQTEHPNVSKEEFNNLKIQTQRLSLHIQRQVNILGTDLDKLVMVGNKVHLFLKATLVKMSLVRCMAERL